MSIKKTTIAAFSILFLAATIVGSGLVNVNNKGAEAAPPQQTDGQRTITVTGFGSANGAPDIAYMNIGVETFNTDIATAFSDNNTRIDSIMAALAGFNIPPEDIRTEYFNIYQDQSTGPDGSEFGPGGPPGLGSYRISNVMTVVVRDTEQVDEILTAVIEAGANVVNGVSFDIADRTALQGEARVDALDDARVRAQQVSDHLGVTLGEVLSVNENAFEGGIPFAASGFGGGNASISSGPLSVNMSMTVTYAIQ
jgi:uncharacterized protein YggE